MRRWLLLLMLLGLPALAQNPRIIQRLELVTYQDVLFLPGQTVRVRMLGLPGGQAHFDLGKIRDIPMVEKSPGRYEGSYKARLEDHDWDATVVFHLHMSGGQQAREEGEWRLDIGLPERPPLVAGQVIQSVTDTAQDALLSGQTLHVIMMGVPGGHATFSMGYWPDIPMPEVAPGAYVGSWTVPAEQDGGGVSVPPGVDTFKMVVHLRLPNGEQHQRPGPDVDVRARI